MSSEAKEIMKMMKEKSQEFYKKTMDDFPDEGFYRCYHLDSYHFTSISQCYGRTQRPDQFAEECGSANRGKLCPIWAHLTKPVRRAIGNGLVPPVKSHASATEATPTMPKRIAVGGTPPAPETPANIAPKRIAIKPPEPAPAQITPKPIRIAPKPIQPVVDAPKPIRRPITAPPPKAEETPTVTSGASIEHQAFCVGCGYWLTGEEMREMAKGKGCPKCKYPLFRITKPGAREYWEKQKAEIDAKNKE